MLNRAPAACRGSSPHLCVTGRGADWAKIPRIETVTASVRDAISGSRSWKVWFVGTERAPRRTHSESRGQNISVSHLLWRPLWLKLKVCNVYILVAHTHMASWTLKHNLHKNYSSILSDPVPKYFCMTRRTCLMSFILPVWSVWVSWLWLSWRASKIVT